MRRAPKLMKDNPPDSAQALATTLNFTEDDLKANREGRLSAAQQGRLRSQVIFGIVGAALMVLVLLGVGLWIVALGSWWVASAFFTLALLIFVLNRSGRGKFGEEVRAGAVALAAGEITLTANEVSNPNGGVTEYLLTVNGESFVIPRDAFIAFEDNAVYRVYYLPHSRIVLAAEPG
jgi:hypothetical protein